MVTWNNARPHPEPTRRHRARGWLDALFGEAWDLQRRRRRRYAAAGLVAVAVLALAVGLWASQQHTSPPPRAIAPIRAVTDGPVTSEILPAGAPLYSSLIQAGGHLVLWGDGAGGVDGLPTGLTGPGTGSQHCSAATVDPATLALGPVRRGVCGDPSLFGERVIPSIHYTRGGSTGLIETLHIDTASSTAAHGFTAGPALLSFQECSDCEGSWIYGDGALWFYVPDVIGRRGPGAGELLDISGRTGRVLGHWWLPTTYRPLLASDADGVWLAPSIESGYPAGATAQQRIDDGSLYRVSPRAGLPRRTALIGAGGALWLVAAGHTVWVNAGTSLRTTVTAYRGAAARQVARTPIGLAECGYEPHVAQAAADPQAGVACTNGMGGVFSAPASTGARSGVTWVHFGHQIAYGTTPSVMLGHSFYFLDPADVISISPTRRHADGPGALYRVAVR